ncbi:hypothetical protein J437_LFUL010660, partial [Ladona fulva]
TTDEPEEKLDAGARETDGAESEAGDSQHHPDYTVAIVRNPFSKAKAAQLPSQGQHSFYESLQLNQDTVDNVDRSKRHSGQPEPVADAAAKGSGTWEEPLAEASKPDTMIRTGESSESSPDGAAAAAEPISSIIYGQRIVPRVEPPAQEQHFFPSFASLFTPPPPPSPVLSYSHDSSINRPRHSNGGGRSQYNHYHSSPYSGFDSYGDEEDDSFGLFQGSEHGTPKPPPPVLQPPRTKPSYQARQQSSSANTDSKHLGLLGSGNFAVMRGGTFYDDKDKSEYHNSYSYSDPYGNGHGGPSYNSGNYHRGLPSNPRPRPGRDHFADFRDFADITAPKPAFSQLVVVYAANQNGTEDKKTNSTNQNSPPRNIIERLKLLDTEEGREESESQVRAHEMEDMALWDGEGGREDDTDEYIGGDEEEEEEDDGNVPPSINIIPRPNNIIDKLNLLDSKPELTTEEEPKKEKQMSLGKRKLTLMRVKGKWVSDKAKRLSKEAEPLLALS